MPALNPAYESQGTRVLPLCYGYVLATGDKVLYFTAEDGKVTQVYLLGEGEWDGLEYYASSGFAHLFKDVIGFTNPTGLYGLGGWTSGFLIQKELHFHSGAYTTIGCPTTPNSIGPDQGYDSWMAAFPSVIPPQAFSGIAYYVVQGGGAVPLTPVPGVPIGIWRSTRCRIFDAYGNVTSYAFTCNPTWHFIDATLRYQIKPQQPGLSGLTDAEKACFNWDSVVTHAARNEQLIEGSTTGFHPATSGLGGYYSLGTPVPRFVGNYAFAADATLTNVQETILRCCRSFQRIDGQRIELIGDDPRNPVFFFGANHLVPGSLNIGKKNVSKSPNIFIGKYRDLNIPALLTVQSATHIAGPATQVVIDGVSPLLPNSTHVMVLGGCADSGYDGEYKVNVYSSLYLPGGAPNPATNEILLYNQAGSSASTTGGFMGVNDARFSPRAPLNVQHRHHQQAIGQQAPGLSQRPRLVPQEYDLGNMTYDQANRLMQFERNRYLGPDVDGWQAPFTGTIAGYLESVDAQHNPLIGVQEGDVIQIDDWVTPEFAGQYEVMKRNISAPSNNGQGDATLGQVQLELLQYQPSAFTDVSDPADATYQSVPNSSLDFNDRTVYNAAWVLQATPQCTVASDGTLTMLIPDLEIQLMGVSTPTFYPGFSVSGIVSGQPYMIYVDTQNMVGGVVKPLYGAQPGTTLTTNPVGRVLIYSGSFTASTTTTTTTTGGTTVHPAVYTPTPTF